MPPGATIPFGLSNARASNIDVSWAFQGHLWAFRPKNSPPKGISEGFYLLSMMNSAFGHLSLRIAMARPLSFGEMHT